MRATGRRPWGRILLALVVLAATASCLGGPRDTGTITLLTPWTNDDEQQAFGRVLDAFRAKYPGVHVDVNATRAADQVLQSDVQRGEPPDLAVMPNPGMLGVYARQGNLVRLDRLHDAALRKTLLDELRSDYAPLWYDLERVGSPAPYAVVVKANVKSLVWYDPHRLGHQAPGSLSGLLALDQRISRQRGTPWCLALSDPPSTGYPGTDWIEDILLHQSGPAVYQRWVSGRLSWTSPQVEAAWKTWGRMTAADQVHGGPLSALLTAYGEGDYPLFGDPPGCYLHHSAVILPRGKPTPVEGTDYDFFAFPPDAPSTSSRPSYEVSGDLVGMFRDSAPAELLMAFLAGPQAQRIWPGIQPDQAFSADRSADLLSGAYRGHPVAARVYRLLTSDSATLCFDASDLMPDTMTTAFYRAVLGYVQDPSALRAILGRLDQVRSTAYAGEPPPSAVCG